MWKAVVCVCVETEDNSQATNERYKDRETVNRITLRQLSFRCRCCNHGVVMCVEK